MQSTRLTRFAYLSIGASIATILLKFLAFYLTNSVGLLSDAFESFINLAAAVMTLILLTIATKPPDENHLYGHTKVEYFSSVIEGILIIIAAISIIVTAIPRLIHPQPLETAYIGIAISILASVVNLLVARILIAQGKKNNSISLQADGHHLMTDVWTSVGIIIAICIVFFTGLLWLDPVIALLVAINIIFTGYRLLKESIMGLTDSALVPSDAVKVTSIINSYRHRGIRFHGLRSRQAGMRKFVSFHVLVPGTWSVKQGHDLLDEIEQKISSDIPLITVTTHLEPLEDNRSYEDDTLDRMTKNHQSKR